MSVFNGAAALSLETMDEVILRGKSCLSSRDVLNTEEGGWGCRGGREEVKRKEMIRMGER